MLMTLAAIITANYADLCEKVTNEISALVQAKPLAVLGLATGATPLGVYDRLVRRVQNDMLDFSGVTCFNLDEYYPMPAGSPHSYHTFMQAHLFQHVPCRGWFVPDGQAGSPAEIAQRCRGYEAQIAAAGGIDLQILGIGHTGHIGFNEPGSSPDSRTRRVTLSPQTREDAAEGFGGLGSVPQEAVTMGIGTISEARQIILMASGRSKAKIVREALTGEITERLPASWVRTHPNAGFYLDQDAAALLGDNL